MTRNSVHPDDPRVSALIDRISSEKMAELADWRGSHYERETRSRVAQYLDRIPERFRSASLDGLHADQHPEGIRAWLDDPDALTLWFDGPVGVGKSMAAAATANETAARAVLNGMLYISARWWTVAGFLDALRPGRDEDDSVWDQAKGARLLVLDDFAHVRPSPWGVERLWMLVNHRVSEGLRTVCTTNMDTADLRDVWGDGIVDRLQDSAYAIQIHGASRRTPIAAYGATA